jgi:membrane-associated phospholipid phosphatase
MLQIIDAACFELINGTLSNPVFDAVLPWCREKWFWAPVYLFIVAFCLLNFRYRGWLVIAGLVLTFAVSDMTSSQLIKKNVKRLRPCNEPTMEHRIVERVPCGGGYSFTSSHATNHFAVSAYIWVVLGGFHRRLKYIVFAWAALVAFAQVYVGVHYPLDVICGALVGTMIGWGSGIWINRVFGPLFARTF